MIITRTVPQTVTQSIFFSVAAVSQSRAGHPKDLRLVELEAEHDAISRWASTDIELSMDGTILRANENFLAVMGYTLPEVLGRHHSMFVAPQDRSSPEYKAFWDGLKQGQFTVAEYRRVAKDGHTVWIQASYNPVLNPAGEPVKVIKFATDITAQRLKSADDDGQIIAITRSQAVIEFSIDGTILNANENFLSVVGYDLAEVVGQHHSMFVDKASQAGAEYRAFWRRLGNGEYFSAEFKRVTKDGREIWLQASYNPIFDAEGNPRKVVKYATDITTTKLQSLDFAGQIAAIGKSQAVIEFSMAGEILTVNENFLRVMGYDAQEVIGQHHSMFVDPDDVRDPDYAEFWASLNRGEYVAREFRRVDRNGDEVWIQASYNPIFDLDGAPFKVVKFATDITAEVARRQVMKQLSLVANGTDNSVLITNAQRRIEYVNPGFERLTGYSAAEVIGKNPGQILQGTHTDAETIKRIRHRLDRGEPFYDEILNYTKAGKPYWISLAINPVHDANGRVERFISIQANINETKQRALEHTIRLSAIGQSNALAEWSVSGQIASVNGALDHWGALTTGHAAHLDQILAKEDRARLMSAGNIRTEVTWLKADGTTLHLDAVFSAMRDLSGQVTQILMCGSDVSDRRIAVDETASATRDVLQSGELIADIVLNIDAMAFQTEHRGVECRGRGCACRSRRPGLHVACNGRFARIAQQSMSPLQGTFIAKLDVRKHVTGWPRSQTRSPVIDHQELQSKNRSEPGGNISCTTTAGPIESASENAP